MELVDEYEREKRRKNVVAFNIPEKTMTDQESDEKTFLNIMNDEFNLIPRIESYVGWADLKMTNPDHCL